MSNSLSAQSSSTAPLPGGAIDGGRREQNAKRLRIMDGKWLVDLKKHMTEQFVDIRADEIGKPDLSTNLLLSVSQQLSALYQEQPIVINDTGDTQVIEDFTQELTNSGLWSIANDNQEYTLAMRECFIKAKVTVGGLLFEIVTPNNVYAESTYDNPDVPSLLIEARIRTIDDEEQWTFDYYDIRNPAFPECKVLLAEKEGGEYVDITEQVLGSNRSGEDYPFRFTQGTQAGTPFIPYSTYHAKRTGKLWDSYRGLEVVEGTLTMAVLWSFWLHNVKDNSWAQRWTIDAYIRGTQDVGKGNTHQAVLTAPGTVLQFMSDGDNPSIGQWNPAIDPEKLGLALSAYERRIATYFGLSPQDFDVSISAESGFALTVKRQSIRELQKTFEQTFRRADIDLISKAAAMLNLIKGTSIPEDGWNISYPGLPRSSQEVMEELTKIEKLIALNLASKVDAYIVLNPGTSREAAVNRLQEIAKENRVLTV